MLMEVDGLTQNSVGAEAQDPNVQLFDNPMTRILVLCHHAQSRSKMVGRVLDDLGYANVHILGIRDPLVPRSEQLELMGQAAIIVSTAKDITAEIKHHLADQPHGSIVEVPFTEQEHARAVVSHGRDEKLKQAIRERVAQIGFHEVKKNTD